MPLELQHELNLDKSFDESAKLDFVASLRAYVLNDMANSMRSNYESSIEPQLEKKTGQKPNNGSEVLKALRGDSYFQFYSSMRCTAQRMVWNSVIDTIERQQEDLNRSAASLVADRPRHRLDQALELPDNVAKIDVHLAPGSYHTEYADGDVTAGAIYDNGLAVFSFGMMGLNLDDIGMSMANYIRHRFPEFKPQRILDMGCTVGHNTSALAKTWPNAEVIGIDVSAPLLRYADARSQSQQIDNVSYQQMNATELSFEDESFDMVFSSMFLHELSAKQINQALSEAHRVLRHRGLLLNMELPPSEQLPAYDNFYLDWDSYFNNEPYYKHFRAQNPQQLCIDAGFNADDYLQFTCPQYTYISDDEFQQRISTDDQSMDDKTGRLSNELNWFGFGAWKSR